MRINISNSILKLISIMLVCTILYLPSLTNFFSADDWFHLRLAQINTVNQFLNYFLMTPTEQTASFYRPITTQVFFFILYKIFGLWAMGWYLINLILFNTLLFVLYKFLIILLSSINEFKLNIHNTALATTLIYGVSVTHFTHIYFLSTFQEIGMIVFILLGLIGYLNNYKIATSLWFILSLMSKETGIVFPLLIIIVELIKQRITFNFHEIFIQSTYLVRKIFYILIISILYLYARFYIFPAVQGDSYIWNFSFFKLLNTLFWYYNWSLGVPEMVIDFVGSGLKPIDRFYSVWGGWWIPISLGYILLGFMIVISICINKLINLKLILFSLLWFLVSLLPVLFLPWHKYVHSLGLPMIGFSIFLAIIILNTQSVGRILFVLFVFYNFLMNIFNYQYHPSIQRSRISKQVVEYFQSTYPEFPDKPIWFIADGTENLALPWGGSPKQIANSVSTSDLFKVLYQDSGIQVHYQSHEEFNLPDSAIIIPATYFIK